MRITLRFCLLLGACAPLALAQTPPTSQDEEIRKFAEAIKAAEKRAATQSVPTPAEQFDQIDRFRELLAEAEERWALETTGLTPLQQMLLRGAISEARTRQTSPTASTRSPFGFPQNTAAANTPSPFRAGLTGQAAASAQFRNTSFAPPAGFFTPVGSSTRGSSARPR